MKIKIIVISILITISFSLFAQIAPGVYLIEFTDKNNSEYSISRPEEFLSQRAIERRNRYNIPFLQNDLPVNQSYIDSVKNVGVEVRFASKWFNSVVGDINDTAILNTLEQISFVKNISKKSALKQEIKSSKFEIENETFMNVNLQKKISIAYENSLDYGFYEHQIAMLNGQFLHNKGFKGENMIIAVNDAGFYRVNSMQALERLNENNGILGTKDFVNFDGDVFNDNAHGAYIVSLIAANVPGVAVGAAPYAKFYLNRTEEVEFEYIIEEENWIAAIEFADSAGADILTSSVSYTIFLDSLQNHTAEQIDGNSTRITKAADIAASKGILVFNSAGNEGNKEWKYITFPSDADSIMAIGSVDSLGLISPFSSLNYPGNHNVKPNAVAQGEGTYILGTNDNVFKSNGTSYSTPIMAGLAACLWQAFPEKTNIEIKSAIEQSANYYNTPNASYGYGIPNFAVAYNILNGTSDITEINNSYLNVFPNPFSDNLKVELNLPFSGDIHIQLIDLMGNLIYNSKITSNSTYNEFYIKDLDILNPGLYFLRIIAVGSNFTTKIMKGK